MSNAKHINEIISELKGAGRLKSGEISDGIHTFDELYEHRNLLYIFLCKGLDCNTDIEVWKTQNDSKGRRMVGWFILGSEDEREGQITYHLPIKYWELCSFAKTIKKSRWNGHNSKDVVKLLTKLLKDD